MAHTISWSARWWGDDGAMHDERGSETVDAGDEREAAVTVQRALRNRFGAPRRPLRLAIGDAQPLDGATYYQPDAPDAPVAVDELRARVLGGARPRAIADELLAGGISPLDVMILFTLAFHLDMEEVGDVAVRGGPATVEMLIAERRPRWQAPYRVRQARYRGSSLVDTLHELKADGAQTLELFMALREAFDLAFDDTKELIELACNRDRAFDAYFARALARARGED